MELVIALDACGTFSRDKRRRPEPRWLGTLGIEMPITRADDGDFGRQRRSGRPMTRKAALDMPFAVLMAVAANAHPANEVAVAPAEQCDQRLVEPVPAHSQLQRISWTPKSERNRTRDSHNTASTLCPDLCLIL